MMGVRPDWGKEKKFVFIILDEVFVGFVLILFVALLPFYYKLLWSITPSLGDRPAEPATVDILAFWGAIFGGIITLVGVFLSIRFSHREIEENLNQQDKERFMRVFPGIILEINSINGEISKFEEYLLKYKESLREYMRSGQFEEIRIEHDNKQDYIKIKDEKKPRLEIIMNRFEGKAAQAR